MIASYVQSRLDPYRAWVWFGFGVALVVAIGVAIWEARRSRDSKQTSDGNDFTSENDRTVIAPGDRAVAIGGNAESSAINTGDRNILGDGFRVDGDYVAGDKISHHQHQSSITDPEFFTSKTDHHEQPFDYEVYIGSQWGDLKIGAVSEFLELERVSRQEDYNQSLNAKQQFEQFRFVRAGSKPTYGANLCFGESPNIVVAGCETKCFYWKETNRNTGFHDSQVFQGNLVTQLSGALSFLKKHLRLERHIGGERRSEAYDLPIVALEEAIANALIHREYRNRNDGIRVDLFEDRVEIVSPGGLPHQVPLEVLGVEPCTYPRNPLIARVFYLYGYVEQAGTGINRMREAMLATGLPAPEFKVGPTVTFEVILRRANLTPEIRALHQLPPPPVDFTGREEELANLKAAIEDRGVIISALQGMGGIGKTALALKLAEQLMPLYHDAQFFINLRGSSPQPMKANDAMAHVIRAFEPNVQLPRSEAELRGLYQSVLHNQRVILLLDDVASPEQFEPLIPTSPSIMLVTSRQRLSVPGLSLTNLATLAPQDARQLLLGIAPRLGDEADKIAELCGYLPLALRLAGAALGKFADLRPSDYIRRLKNAQERLQLVDASLSLSYELLNEDSRRLWRALAVFPETFDAEAAAAVWELDIDITQEHLSQLFAASLLDWGETTNRYRLHKLARLFADSRQSADERMLGQRRHAAHYQAVTAAANSKYMKGGEAATRALALFDLEWPNIEAGQAWAKANSRTDDNAERLRTGYANDVEFIVSLRQPDREALRSPVVDGVVATGERAVAIGGNASDVNITTGDNNVVLSLKETDAASVHEILNSVAPTRLHELPSPPRDFTGREDELTELTARLEQGGITLSALHGLGGIGKTALALKLADQLTSQYPDAQFYLDLKGTSSNPLTVAEAMVHVIRAYHPTAKVPDIEAELNGLYRSVLQDQRALLLMDNAAGAEQVEPLIPPESCVLLVTSRLHFTLPGLFAKNLEALSPEDANKLLLTIAPRIDAQANEIARLCGYLPLALRLAASALMKFVNLTPADYLLRLRDSQSRLQLIEASLNLSYELLSDQLQKWWRLLAVFPDTFEERAAAAIWSLEVEQAQDALGELIAASMVEWDQATRRYRLHDLARVFADSRLGTDERADAKKLHAVYFKEILATANTLYVQGGDDMTHGIALLDLEWSNIREGQAWAETNAIGNEMVATLPNQYSEAGGELLYMRQNPLERIRWLESALDSARYLKDRAAEGVALGNLGLTLDALGDTQRAIELHKEYLNISREIADRNSEGIALGNLGLAYFHLGETRRAIELYEQRLKIANESNDRRGLGIILSNLGVAHNALGQIEPAIKYFEEALIRLREIGDQRVICNTLLSLGDSYFALGDKTRGIAILEDALRIARDIGYDFGEGRALGALGQIYARLGQMDSAIEFLEESLRVSRVIGDRRNEGNALGSLGSAYTDLGKTDDAIRLYEEALIIFREIGYVHGESSVLGNLGYAYEELGEMMTAVDFYTQQLNLTRKIEYVSGEANALWNMSLAKNKLGDQGEATALAQAALKIYEQLRDPHAHNVREQLVVWRGSEANPR